VRCNVAKNAATPTDILEELGQKFASCMVENPSAPIEVLCAYIGEREPAREGGSYLDAAVNIELRLGGDYRTHCGIPTPTPASGFGSGTQLVGEDIVPGTYRARGGSLCYWERLRGFGGTVAEIIANGFGHEPAIVTIAATDVGFRSQDCGSWTLVD
jgi:hypothetical protein